MGKRVFVVPPQAVRVNVSVNVGQVPQQGVPAADAMAAQVNTAVHVSAPAWGGTAPVASLPYTPPFTMPTSDVLRRTWPMLARRGDLGLGDHVHTTACVDGSCHLLAAQLPPKVTARPWAMLGWLLVAMCVWVVQYSLVVPLAWLGAVARSCGAKAAGWFAILLCGLGPFYALFYLCSPHVPRHALRPWGLGKDPQPLP